VVVVWGCSSRVGHCDPRVRSGNVQGNGNRYVSMGGTSLTERYPQSFDVDVESLLLMSDTINGNSPHPRW
jgi:hypothetical protein